ncbi:uncharacterized protein LOC124927971 [Impatiens glandulifera]|uniref:uncharacterized protein LOC124927971 n=1 Tax=Impatiens glandulifera TaxID=253017 RepID=UPI001FB1845D|nr:uncharacterized protein LOC124927971 [Impatiens glandulifera]
MKSFDRSGNHVDLNTASLRTIIDDNSWDISSTISSSSSSSSVVYVGLRGLKKDSKHAAAYVSQRTRRGYDWKKMDRSQQQEGEEIKRRSPDEREQDPLEILRKLDELKDQINRSWQVNEKPSYPNQILPDPVSSSYMHRREMDIHRFHQPTQQFSHHSSSSSNVSPPFQARREGHLSSESVGFSGNGHRIPIGRRRCHPIAGGSPFVTCCNCFELLQVPRKVLFLETNQKKIQCGGCLTVLLLEVVNKKLFVSVSVSEFPSQISNEEAVGDSLPSRHQTVNEGSSLINGNMIQEESLKHSSDGSEHDLKDMNGGEPTTSSSIHAFNSGKSASPHSSVDVNNTPEKKSDGYAEIIPTTVKPPLPKGSSLQDYFDQSNIYSKVNQFDEGNQSKSSEKDLGMPKKAFLQEDSTKDASLATEIDVSFQYTISTTSQESDDASIEGSSITNKVHQQSLLAAGIKKQTSIRDQDTIINVTINGNDVPDHLVKEAEKRAGPIKPGNYWYDFSAGFWGVMGGPCLGIIPPFIEELNYPMDGNCAGGETGVFVNGRELHPKDFDRLCSRGLPKDTNRSYDIEFSGKVFDGISGEQLKGLGRLAPSVEKSKRGFGMKPPRKVAD